MPRRPGAKAIVVYQGKILLILRDNDPNISYPNTWNLPGGGIEEGETPEQAMLRELEEELCIKIDHIQQIKKTVYSDGSLVYRYLSILSKEESEQIRLGDEGQRFAWFSLDEALACDLSPYLRAYLESNLNGIRELVEG